MAWHDRDYNRDEATYGSGGGYRFGGGGGGVFGGPLGKHSVVAWLLGINIVVFLLDTVLSSGVRTASWASLSYWGNYNLEQGIYGFQLWRLLTFQFLHGDLFHILMNMIGLYFFGRMLEGWWGPRRFLAFYLLCGVSGAVVMTVLSFIPGLLMIGPTTTLVGASGGLFGILAGAAVIAPNQVVRLLFPPIPMKIKTMALVFLGLSALSVLAGASNAGGDAAHLGGALLGWVLVKNAGWLNFADRLSPQAIQAGVAKGRYEKKQKQAQQTEADVDRILDKVRDQGLQSLTKAEKKKLNEATQRQRDAG